MDPIILLSLKGKVNRKEEGLKGEKINGGRMWSEWKQNTLKEVIL